MPRGGLGGAPRKDNGPSADALRRYVDAQMELGRAQQNSQLQGEAGGSFARLMARRREMRAETAVSETGGQLTGGPTPEPTPKPTPKPPLPDPTVKVPTKPTPTPGLPKPPPAVTDPASEISPEEQNARLRARIMLMNAGTRAGRMIATTSSQLGFRSLMGL